MLRTEKNITSERPIKEISVALVLLVRPNPNNLSLDSIASFLKIKSIKSSQKYISIPNESFNKIENSIKDSKNIKLILQPKFIALGRSKLKFLNSKLKEDYVIIVHDDDIYSPQLICKPIEIIKKYSPIALALHATQVDQDLKIFKGRRSNNSKRTKKLSPIKVLARYFLPFEKALITPAIFLKRTELIRYWEENGITIGSHEDVKMHYILSQRGDFLEWENPNLYFYRMHKNQDSFQRNEFDRLRLIAWLKNLELNSIYKIIFLGSSKLQYFIFYKKIKTRFSYLSYILKELRMKLIRHRNGGKVFKKLKINDLN